ncbi:MAG: asparaginase [Rhizobiaceae bacterium]|nr:asparaginase [Rhizobiaceae bacterium]
MTNPVLVEVLRGGIVESVHRGAAIVCDASGAVVLEIGDADQPVFPRSAVKAIQALPLVESGAADKFGFGNRELALACASHSGESAHAELAAAMLASAGLDEAALECGAHWPLGDEATRTLARAGGEPRALHNNCSGKHSGFICTCVQEGVDPAGYVGRNHQSQQWVREAMEAVTGVSHGEDICAIDGCSIPTYAVPLRSLALGFARMATGASFGPERAKAAQRIFAACMAEPFFVAGTDRMDTKIMEAGKGRVFTKTGAEGVFCAALPEFGLGIALKCDDGATRAAETMVASLIARLLKDDAELSSAIGELARPKVLSRRGAEVGEIRPAAALR